MLLSFTPQENLYSYHVINGGRSVASYDITVRASPHPYNTECEGLHHNIKERQGEIIDYAISQVMHIYTKLTGFLRQSVKSLLIKLDL